MFVVSSVFLSPRHCLIIIVTNAKQRQHNSNTADMHVLSTDRRRLHEAEELRWTHGLCVFVSMGVVSLPNY